MLTERELVVNLFSPKADRFDTSGTSPYFTMANHDRATILVAHQGGTTGKATLTVKAASDSSGTGATAIAYNYRRKTTGASVVFGAITAATSAGIDTVPTEDTVIEIEVSSAMLPDGKQYLALAFVESVNDPVNGSAIAILGRARFAGTSQPNVLA